MNRNINVPSVEDEPKPLPSEYFDDDFEGGQTADQAMWQTAPQQAASVDPTEPREPVRPKVERTQVYNVQQMHAQQERIQMHAQEPAPMPYGQEPIDPRGYAPRRGARQGYAPQVYAPSADYREAPRQMQPVKKGPSIGSILGLVLGLGAIFFSLQPWITSFFVAESPLRLLDLVKYLDPINSVLQSAGVSVSATVAVYGYLGAWGLGCILTVIGSIMGIAARRKALMIIGLLLLLLVAGGFLVAVVYIKANYGPVLELMSLTFDTFQPIAMAGCALLGIILGAAVR